MNIPFKAQLFGRMEIQIHGKPLPPLHGRAELWILALLLLQRGKSLERDRIAGMLWPESNDRTALSNLRSSLSRLRNALGEEAYRIQKISPRSLMFISDGAEVDLYNFETLLAAATHFTQLKAVDLYRGPLLEECSEIWITGERTRCENLALEALDCIAHEERRQNNTQKATNFMKRILEVDPYRESTVYELMQLNKESGLYLEVTEVYRSFRKTLHENLNAVPSPQTTALYNASLKGGSESGEFCAHNNRITVRSGSGQGRPFQLKLPRFLSNLIGRENDLSLLKNMIPQHSLISIVGAGGVGKTRIVCTLAEEIQHQFSDGICFVDLSPLTDPEKVWMSIAQALDIRQGEYNSIESQVVEYLLGRETLLILDNCEHLLPKCAVVAAKLTSHCPLLKLLATSRKPLGINGEQVWRTPSLEVAGNDTGAVALFVDRVRSHSSSFNITLDNQPHILSICRKLDGIPLALELAAAQVRATSIRELSKKLDSDFRLLVNIDLNANSRHHTVERLIAWSYELLNKTEQSLLNSLGMFAGSWTAEQAETLFDSQGEVFSLLTTLVDSSLIQYDVMEERYRLHEMMKAFARERLRERGNYELVNARIITITVSMIQNIMSKMSGPSIIESMMQMDRERDNVNAVLVACSESKKKGGTLLKITATLWPWWERIGLYNEGRQWLKQALAMDMIEMEDAYASALLGAGVLAWFQEEQSGMLLVKEAKKRAEITGDKSTLASALFFLSREAEVERNLPLAIEYIEECLLIRRSIKDRSGELQTVLLRAHFAYRLSEFSIAREMAERAYQMAHDEHNTEALAYSLHILGNINWGVGKINEAKEYFLASIELNEKIGRKRPIAVMLDNLSRMFRDTEQYRDVIFWQQYSRKIWERLGSPVASAYALMWEGLAWAGLGDCEKARLLQKRTIYEGEDLGRDDVVCLGLQLLCKTERYCANLAAVRELHARQIKINITAEPDVRHKALCHYELGLAEFQAGNYDEAQVCFEEALVLNRSVNQPSIDILCTYSLLNLITNRKLDGLKKIAEAFESLSDDTWPGLRAKILETAACVSIMWSILEHVELYLQTASCILKASGKVLNKQDCPERNWAEEQLQELKANDLSDCTKPESEVLTLAHNMISMIFNSELSKKGECCMA